jgi:hypothetical protein
MKVITAPVMRPWEPTNEQKSVCIILQYELKSLEVFVAYHEISSITLNENMRSEREEQFLVGFTGVR